MNIDRILAPVLTFAVLIGGHVAIASALFASPAPKPAEVVAQAPVIQLEEVVIIGKRAS